jgi:hypothetical protein
MKGLEIAYCRELRKNLIKKVAAQKTGVSLSNEKIIDQSIKFESFKILKYLSSAVVPKKYFGFFDQEGDFQDDEVALMHNPTPPYHPFSEPLVHIRACVTDLSTRQEITPRAGQAIIDQLKALYFGERTLETFARLLESVSGKAFGELVPDMAPYRIKQRDVEDFLATITIHS